MAQLLQLTASVESVDSREERSGNLGGPNDQRYERQEAFRTSARHGVVAKAFQL